ncbi:MAG: DUF1587 domain-containing protein, partial [Myxococcaceae bacterium]|nr:DUF1587 domain-containing protein [Myxococcaceae bacterium]
MRRLALTFLLAGCAGEIFTPRPSGSASGEPHGQEPKVERPPCTPSGDPGRVQLHRLNRREYNNAVHDLFGIALRPADAFPRDNTATYFDNDSGLLGITAEQLTLY